MKVRHPLLPGEVLEAKLAERPSLFDRNEAQVVLELDAGAPMQVEPRGAGCELLEATDEEWSRLCEAGYQLRDRRQDERSWWQRLLGRP